MKKSEARILVYLANADKRFTYGREISIKLGMDYVYLSNILSQLKFKNWILPQHRGTRKYWSMTSSCPLHEAIEKLKPKHEVKTNERMDKTSIRGLTE